MGEQAEQAVVTSTLILWRSLGMVLGVSVSSLVLQNSLFGFLQRFVEGADKEKVSLSRPLRQSRGKLIRYRSSKK